MRGVFIIGGILMLVLSDISTVAIAQDSIELPQQECSVSGKFSQTKHLDGLPEPLRSNGVFFFHCDHGVIWKTLDPVQETLVFSQHGTSFLMQGGDIQPLKTRQIKFLGALLNNLIAGSTEEISQQFDLSSIPDTDTQSLHEAAGPAYRLIPRNRSVKRAVKEISLLFSEDRSAQKSTVFISIVDRNNQQTDIKSTRDAIYSMQEEPQQQCLQHESIGADECGLLLPLNAG